MKTTNKTHRETLLSPVCRPASFQVADNTYNRIDEQRISIENEMETDES